MLSVRNGRDDVIIRFYRISDLHSNSICGLSDSADVDSGPSISPIPSYNNVGLLASPLFMTARLVKVVDHLHLAYFASPNTRGGWIYGSSSNGILVGTGKTLTASPLPPTSELVDSRSTMGSGILPSPPSSHYDDDSSNYCVGGTPYRGDRPHLSRRRTRSHKCSTSTYPKGPCN